ncbi:MAG: isoprenylcysteine carboxylmethyltransferase family protein [Lentisphaerae bacterium]|nr:isoprenylcysteine carboxylmethyltransferase family protein [Lentisphaerota bacterium]
MSPAIPHVSESRPGKPGEPSIPDVLMAAFRREVLLNVPIHLFILIPAACLMAHLSTRIDRVLGWGGIVREPWNIVAGILLILAGLLIVWYTYGYLAIMGQGSPGTHLGGPVRLVTTGPYALCRHPSIIGKWLGVTGLGCVVGSPVFLFVVIPMLTAYSLLAARHLQERRCVELWGEAYLAYRRNTPLVIPRIRRLRIKKGMGDRQAIM